MKYPRTYHLPYSPGATKDDKKLKDKLIWGRNYTHVDPNDENKTTRMWICPVTLFVLGRYPKYIYIRKTTI